MIYFDTSFLVPLFIPEDSSDAVEAFIEAMPSATRLLSSHWGRVEFASVMAGLVRMGELEPTVAGTCVDRYSVLVEQSFDIVVPQLKDFDRCKEFLVRFDTGLRAGDALHLAIAANRHVDALYTFACGVKDQARAR